MTDGSLGASPEAAAALARAAEAGIHCLAIPTPFQVGLVNCWLLDDDPLTLLDSGPNSGTALDALERALAERGHRVEDLQLIVISHQHMDHLGLVSILARRSGAEVAALDALAPWAARYDDGMQADDAFANSVMTEHGIPEGIRLALLAVSQSYRHWGASANVTRPLKPGCELRFRDRALRVLHRPGHSPSDTIFHDAERGIVLGADHLSLRKMRWPYAAAAPCSVTVCPRPSSCASRRLVTRSRARRSASGLGGGLYSSPVLSMW